MSRSLTALVVCLPPRTLRPPTATGHRRCLRTGRQLVAAGATAKSRSSIRHRDVAPLSANCRVRSPRWPTLPTAGGWRRQRGAGKPNELRFYSVTGAARRRPRPIP